MSKNTFFKFKNIDEFNSNNLKKLRQTQEYKQNQMQIDCITKILIEHADVPPKLIDWLIESVKQNTTLEYQNGCYLNKKNNYI